MLIKGFKIAAVTLLLLGLIGCNSANSKSTPKGVFKRIDLREKLPTDIAQVTDEQGTEHSKEITLGKTGKKLILKWRTFQKGESRYNLSALIEVPEELKGVQLVSAEGDVGNNMGTKEAVVQNSSIKITWSDNENSKPISDVFSIKSDGTLSEVKTSPEQTINVN